MRAERLISILMQLQVNRRVTARDLAGKLEVSERTILRDMEALGSAGVPVFAERGSGGGWSLLAEYQTRLTGMTPQEIQSLFISRTSGMAADLGIQQSSEGAWTKLHAALPPHARRQAEFIRQRVLIDTRGWREPGESAASLPELLDALWRERQVRFVYEAFAESRERTVHPLGLAVRSSAWYLIAVRDTQLRTYRVSRIHGIEILDATAHRPADFDLAAYWERAAIELRQKQPHYHAIFRTQPNVLRSIRYRGWRLEEEQPEGSAMRIRIRFDTMEEALQFALSFAADVEVVEPVELRDQVRESARRLLEIYDPKRK